MNIRIIPFERLIEQDKNARGVFAKKWEVCVECNSLEEAEKLKEALTQPDQESDDLTVAYLSGVYDGKNKHAPQREWVGLDDEDMKELKDANFDLLYGARWAERKLREKNGG